MVLRRSLQGGQRSSRETARGVALLRATPAADGQRQRRQSGARHHRACAAGPLRLKRSKLMGRRGERSGRDRRPRSARRLYHRRRGFAPARLRCSRRGRPAPGSPRPAPRAYVVDRVADHQQPARRDAEDLPPRAAAGRARASSSAGRRRRSPRRRNALDPGLREMRAHEARRLVRDDRERKAHRAQAARALRPCPGTERVSRPRRDA